MTDNVEGASITSDKKIVAIEKSPEFCDELKPEQQETEKLTFLQKMLTHTTSADDDYDDEESFNDQSPLQRDLIEQENKKNSIQASAAFLLSVMLCIFGPSKS